MSTMTPLNNPISPPHAIPAANAITIGYPAFIRMPEIIAQNAINPPTDKSIPLMMITMALPYDTSETMAVCRITLRILSSDKNLGISRPVITKTAAISARGMRFLNFRYLTRIGLKPFLNIKQFYQSGGRVYHSKSRPRSISPSAGPGIHYALIRLSIRMISTPGVQLPLRCSLCYSGRFSRV